MSKDSGNGTPHIYHVIPFHSTVTTHHPQQHTHHTPIQHNKTLRTQMSILHTHTHTHTHMTPQNHTLVKRELGSVFEETCWCCVASSIDQKWSKIPHTTPFPSPHHPLAGQHTTHTPTHTTHITTSPLAPLNSLQKKHLLTHYLTTLLFTWHHPKLIAPFLTYLFYWSWWQVRRLEGMYIT